MPVRPERMGSRYENDEVTRKASGYSDSTYETIFERLDREGEDVSSAYGSLAVHRWLT
jgi:hypothetical protein